MAERKKWASYRKFPTDDVRAFGEGALLAISVEDARRWAEGQGVRLEMQPTMIAWQYYAEEPRFDGTDYIFVCPAEQSLWTVLTLHFFVVDPVSMVDVVADL